MPTVKWGIVAQQPLVDAMADVVQTRFTEIVAMTAAGIIALLFGLTLAGTLSKPIAEIENLQGRIKEREVALHKKNGTPILCSITDTLHHDENGNTL